MSSFSALRPLRIGCVAYLNAQPLIRAYPGEVTLDHPARLAEMLAGGELDVALVPTIEALRSPDFLVADRVSISSRGAVYSVFLAYHGCLTDLKTVALDPASRTSCHLLKCLLAEFHGLRPRYTQSGAADARLLIGNQAITFRQKQAAEFHYLDLGEEWMRGTGLPFVFAVWCLRPGLADAPDIAANLRQLKHDGLLRLEEIAREQPDFSPEFAAHYLRENIRYDLGSAEKTGLARFGALLKKHGFLACENQELRFV